MSVIVGFYVFLIISKHGVTLTEFILCALYYTEKIFKPEKSQKRYVTHVLYSLSVSVYIMGTLISSLHLL